MAAMIQAAKKNADNNNNQQNNKKTKGAEGVSVYLCYDKILYQALNIDNKSNHSFGSLDGLIDKVLVPVSSLTNDEIHLVDQLAQNPELISHLIALTSPNPNSSSTAQPTAKVQDGLRLIWGHLGFKLNVVDHQGSKFLNTLLRTAPLKFKQIATSLTAAAASAGGGNGGKQQQQQKQGVTTGAMTTNQPKILVHHFLLKGKPVTRAVGFELFGISPQTLANDAAFKKTMAAAIGIKSVAELKGGNGVVFPEKCLFLLQLQGDKCKDIAQYVIKHVNIDAKNVFNVQANGKMTSYVGVIGGKK